MVSSTYFEVKLVPILVVILTSAAYQHEAYGQTVGIDEPTVGIDEPTVGLDPTVGIPGRCGMVFEISNKTGETLALQLSSDRMIWPGWDISFNINQKRSKKTVIPISCECGEVICFGAWHPGEPRISWGVGMNRSQWCTDCCFVCSNNIVPIRLTLRGTTRKLLREYRKKQKRR